MRNKNTSLICPKFAIFLDVEIINLNVPIALEIGSNKK
jgi:hypothetical protein